MATEVIDIVVRQRGARAVQKQLADIAGAAGQADRQILSLNRVLGTLATGAAVRQLATTADTFTLLGNRTRVFANDAEDAEVRLQGIVDTAIKARAPLDATATVFQRLSIAQDSANLSTQDLLDITGTLTKAIAVSGATAQEAEGALRQLAQGIAANRLSGQEFNSVIEQTPRIAQAIADSIGVEVGALRTLANEGKLTRDVVVGSFQAQADTIDSEFGRVIPTLGQAFENLATAVTVFIGELDRSTGISGTVAQTTIDIANAILVAARNTDEWVPLLQDVGAGLAVIAATKAAGAIAGIASAIAGLNRQLVTLALANPFTAIIALASLAAVAAFRFRDSLISVGEQQFTLSALADVISDRIGPAIDFTLRKWNEWADAVDEFVDISGTGLFNDLVRGFNIVARVSVSTASILIEAFRNAATRIGNFFTTIPEALATAARGDFEEAGDLLGNALVEGVFDPIQRIGDETSRIINEELGTDYVQVITNAANSSDILTEASKRTTKALKDQAEAAAAANAAADLPPIDAPIDAPTGVVGLGIDEKSLQKIKDEVRAVREEFDPALALTNEYADQITILDQALDAGVITNQQYTETQIAANEALQEGLQEINLEKLLEFNTVVEGARAGFVQFAADLGSEARIVSEGINSAFSSSLDALTAFATGGKISAKDFGRTIIAEIQKVIIKLLVLKAIQAAAGFIPGGGALTGALGFGGGRQDGGPVQPGNAFVVGERGPEVFVPNSRGTVVPNEMLGAGSQPNVNVSVVNVDDPNAVPEALNTRAGEEAVLNIIQRNPDVLGEIA